MALFSADFASFRTSIATWIDWTDSTTTHLNDLIEVGQNKVQRFLRIRAMETALAATINSSGQATVPSDYLEMKSAYIDSAPRRKLERKSVEFINEKFSDRSVTSNEAYYAREGSNFIFGPAGGEGSVMKGVYYAKGSSMAAGSTVNSIFTAAPEVFLFGVLSEAGPFIGQDARLPMWEGKFQQLLEAANLEAKKEDQSGSRLAATRS